MSSEYPPYPCCSGLMFHVGGPKCDEYRLGPDVSPLTREQPPPKRGVAESSWFGVLGWMRDTLDPLWHLVAADGGKRAHAGEAKYGVAHQHDNGRDHAVDAYQEHLDSCCYWWAEYQKTKSGEAYALFSAAAELTKRCRAYLLARDGR